MGLPFDPIGEARKNWEHHDWGHVDAMAAATSITRAHQIVLSHVNAVLAPLDLNFSRFEAIALLHFTSDGNLPLGKMGERLQVHPASVTNTIDRLERDGLVERQPHPTDRRTTLAVITDEGRRVAEKAAAALGDVGFGLLDVPTEQLQRIEADLREVRHRAGDF